MKYLKLFIAIVLVWLLCLSGGCVTPNSSSDTFYFQSLMPNANSTGSVGSSTYQWQSGYFENLYLNGVPVGGSSGTNITLYYDDAPSGVDAYNQWLTSPNTSIPTVTDSVVVNNNTQPIESYITTTIIGNSTVSAGTWEFDTWCWVSNIIGTTTLNYAVYSRTSGGVETLLFSVSTVDINTTTVTLNSLLVAEPDFTVSPTDKLVIKVSATTTRLVNTTVSYDHNGTLRYSHVHTTLSSIGLVVPNGASTNINGILKGNGSIIGAATFGDADLILPSQTGQSGKFLTTNGSVSSWASTGAGAGTVTQVNTGTGLTGGPITTTGTISIDSTVATLTGVQELTNKTLTDAVAKGTWTASGTWTIPAVTLNGNLDASANQIVNVDTVRLVADGVIKTGVDDHKIYLVGGNTNDSATVYLFGKSHATYPGRFEVDTPNAALAGTLRLTIDGATDIAAATWSNITHSGFNISASGGISTQLDNSYFYLKGGANPIAPLLFISGKDDATAGFSFYTPNATKDANFQRLVINGSTTTAVATWSNTTQTGLSITTGDGIKMAVDNGVWSAYGSTGGAGKGVIINVSGKDYGGGQFFRIYTGNAAGDTDVERLRVSGGVATSVATWTSTDFSIASDNNWLPVTDNTWSIGSASNRLKLVRAVTITPGDLVFENGWKFTESADGIDLLRPDGSLCQSFR